MIASPLLPLLAPNPSPLLSSRSTLSTAAARPSSTSHSSSSARPSWPSRPSVRPPSSNTYPFPFFSLSTHNSVHTYLRSIQYLYTRSTRTFLNIFPHPDPLASSCTDVMHRLLSVSNLFIMYRSFIHIGTGSLLPAFMTQLAGYAVGLKMAQPEVQRFRQRLDEVRETSKNALHRNICKPYTHCSVLVHYPSPCSWFMKNLLEIFALCVYIHVGILLAFYTPLYSSIHLYTSSTQNFRVL